MDEQPLIDVPRFRQVMSHLATGVTVVTTAQRGELHGLTVNAFCSVSLQPLLVLISIDELSRSCQLIAESGIFAVNVLGWQQQFLADRFSGRAPLVDTAFGGVPYFIAQTGAPVLKRSVGWLDCRVTERFVAGDHMLFLGVPIAGDVDETAEPLLFYQSRFSRLGRPE